MEEESNKKEMMEGQNCIGMSLGRCRPVGRREKFVPTVRPSSHVVAAEKNEEQTTATIFILVVHTLLFLSSPHTIWVPTFVPPKPTMQSLLQRGSSLATRRFLLHNGTAVRGFAKDIKFGTEGRAAMLKGVEVLADAVQVSV